jgi:uncharacterized membrane protein YhaH (DUF805 family)
MFKTWSGRINRATFFLSLGIVVALYVVLALVMTKPPAIAEVFLVALAVPRLHDIGLSAWWAVGAIVAEILIAIVVFVTLPMESAMIVMGLFVLAILGLMIWLGAVRGEAGANRYGEPPSPGVGFSKLVQSKQG